MAKLLISKKKYFSIEKSNPYRTRSIKIEARLVSPIKIEIKVQQIDWTLKNKVDERDTSYPIDAEYDYMSLVNHLYKELYHIKQLQGIVDKWVVDRKLTFNYPSYLMKA